MTNSVLFLRFQFLIGSSRTTVINNLIVLSASGLKATSAEAYERATRTPTSGRRSGGSSLGFRAGSL